MQIKQNNNKTYLVFRDDYGKINPFQLGIFANSGHGKGLTEEFIVGEWKKEVGGVVVIIADPKDEAEFSFVQYPPMERYHLDRLKADGMKPMTYNCKLYHPFSFNIPKGYLPDINFFTLSIKDMTREEWSILAESSWDSESIKLMLRVSADLERNKGMFGFLHEIERMTEGKKGKKKSTADPKNWLLHSGGGTAKSVKEIGNLLSPFQKNYFIRRDTCPNLINWKEILEDKDNYHVFLSMWLHDDKLKEFMVLSLLQQIIKNKKHLKTPILIVIPEIKKLCPRNPEGYKKFLSNAISDALVTIRSMGKGMFSILDSQVWSDTDDRVKSSMTNTLFGNLNAKDMELVSKSCSYNANNREKLKGLQNKFCSYLVYNFEDYDAMRFFYPRHMHKEPKYNWIKMYERHFKERMRKYDDIVKYMRKEYKEEEKEIAEMLKKKEEREMREKEEAKNKKEGKIEVPKEKPEDMNKKLLMKLCWETRQDNPDMSFREIGKKLETHHATVKSYIKKYQKYLDELPGPTSEDVKSMIGEGVMDEEVESNFEDDILKELDNES